MQGQSEMGVEGRVAAWEGGQEGSSRLNSVSEGAERGRMSEV